MATSRPPIWKPGPRPARSGRRTIPSRALHRAMTIARRHLLLAGISGVSLSACSTALTRYSGMPLPEIAAHGGISHASHVRLRAGIPDAPVLVQGCERSAPAGPDGILQAASLPKPVVACVALELVLAGKIDLQAPVSTYLPKGYRHRQRPFAGPGDHPVDWVTPSTLARIPVASLLNHSSGLPNWSNGALLPAFQPGQRWQYS